LSEQELYRIGTVAKLTGVTVECLRAWERRYGLQPAERSGKTRYYSPDQLDQLAKIKRLIDQGHPISTVVTLSHEQLDARLTTNPARRATARVPQVGLIGAKVLILEQDGGDSEQIEVAGRWIDVDDFTDSRPAERNSLDALVVQLPSLALEPLLRAQRAAPDCRLITLYQYASDEAIAEAQSRGANTLEWPLTWTQLERACASPAGPLRQAGKTAPRRFTDRELVDIVARARAVGDDLPRHLVGLISDLNAFVDYNTQRVTEAPEAAERHDRVREEVSYQRSQLERLLAEVNTLTPDDASDADLGALLER
jgi:DNA-binding transcriptional MerR regulator